MFNSYKRTRGYKVINGAVIFHSPLENKWVLEWIDVIDSIDLIVTKEQGVITLWMYGVVFIYGLIT